VGYKGVEGKGKLRQLVFHHFSLIELERRWSWSSSRRLFLPTVCCIQCCTEVITASARPAWKETVMESFGSSVLLLLRIAPDASVTML
jgi:hypothetical protein